MRVALFGQTGQVGEALLEWFPKVQWICADRNRAGGDLREPEKVYQWLLDTRPNAIVNAAAFTAVDRVPENYDEAMTVNARAPAVMARAAKALGAYFIHLSTDYVFDGSGVKPWEPDDKVCPINAYGKTKAEAEKRIAEETDFFTILRLSWLHAPGHVNFVTSFCKRLQTQSEVSVVDDQWGSPTAAEDVASVIERLLQNFQNQCPVIGIVHFANVGFCSRYECACEIVDQLQKLGVSWSQGKRVLRAKTSDFPAMEPRPCNCRLSTAEFTKKLSFTPRSWQEALRETLTQYD